MPVFSGGELAAFRIIELHSLPPARDRLQDIELMANSQRVLERLYAVSLIEVQPMPRARVLGSIGRAASPSDKTARVNIFPQVREEVKRRGRK